MQHAHRHAQQQQHHVFWSDSLTSSTCCITLSLIPIHHFGVSLDCQGQQQQQDHQVVLLNPNAPEGAASISSNTCASGGPGRPLASSAESMPASMLVTCCSTAAFMISLQRIEL